MTRIVEHRRALPFGAVVELHVRYDPECEFPVHEARRATVGHQARPHYLTTLVAAASLALTSCGGVIG